MHILIVDEQFTVLLSQSPFMKDLERLVLIRAHFDPPHMFFELLRHCPRLRLHCCHVTSFSAYPDLQRHPNNHDTDDQDVVMSELKALEVVYSPGLLEYIGAHWGNSIPHLTTLKVDSMDSENTLERILAAVGSSLQDLRLFNSTLNICEWLIRLSFPWCSPYSLFIHFAAFADRIFPFLTQLQSLTVQFTWADTFGFVQYMLHALRHLTSPRLQELSIYIGKSPNHLDVWSELGEHLESSQCLSTLLKLTIRFDIHTHPKVIDMGQRFFAEIFPLCAKRGILHVDSAVWE
jgi:hypothetical protein